MVRVRKPLTEEQIHAKAQARLEHNLKTGKDNSYEKRRVRMAVPQSKRILEGKCRNCNEPRLPNSTMCQTHLDSKRRRGASKSTSNKYSDCSNERMPGGSRCESCYTRTSERGATRRAEWKSKCICTQCGKKPAVPDKVLCEDCRSDQLLRTKKYRDYRTEAGLCLTCGNSETLPELKTCRQCYMKQTSIHHFGSVVETADLDAMFERQDGRCFYSGRVLTLGMDSSLDHTYAIATGGPNSLENVRWVHRMVNQAKWDYNPSEFLGLVRDIYYYQQQHNSLEKLRHQKR